MGYIVRMPQMGMSMEEGVVIEWKVERGESVEEDEIIVVVESEKASKDIQARENGILRRIVVEEGDTVSPGAPIAIVADSDGDLEEYEREIETATEGEPGQTDRGETDPDQDAGDATEDVRATPGARKRANEQGIDLAGVEGTGPAGVVTEADVEGLLEQESEDEEAAWTVSQRRELSGVQRTISDRLGESYRNAVHVTLNRSFDATSLREVLSLAEAAREDVSMTDLLIKAIAGALEKHPEFNAVFEEGEHVLVEEINVGVAVNSDEGLLTPVIPSVSDRTVEEVGSTRAQLVDRIERGQFTMDDFANGTFTVTNLGPYGVDHFDPVINPPQVAILGIGRIRDDDEMTLSLTFDHRVVNGADAATFLETLTSTLTDSSELTTYFGASIEVEDSLGDREIRVENTSAYSGHYKAAYGDVAFDEPEKVGGTGSAPSPVDHLLGALGSCLSLSLREFARRDGVEIDEITVTVSGEPDEGPLEQVDMQLEITSDVSSSEVTSLVTKAERACYVARSLSDDIDVSVEGSANNI